jgi:DNA-binding transcriptional LysR family regulator
MYKKFILSETESELLLAFESTPGLESLSVHLGRDITVISRQLKRISEKADVLSKISGRWVLTEKGRRFNQATQDFLISQNSIISERYRLRIGTNREFSSRCISPNIKGLREIFKNVSLEFRAYEQGTEQALLAGEIDIAFDCGKPQSPEIKYVALKKESILAVAAPSFIKKYGKIEQETDFSQRPHIYCERLRIDRIAGIHWDSIHTIVSTNDIASARTMALQGIGWALLPVYAMKTELEKKQLIQIHDRSFDQEKYGVWRLRTRSHLDKDYSRAVEWMQSLEF